MNKGNIITILIIILLVLGGVWYIQSQDISQNSFQPADKDYDFGIDLPFEEASNKIDSSCTSDAGKNMTFDEAYKIAINSECNIETKVLPRAYCNQNGGGIISLRLQTGKEGCSARCDVSIDDKNATIGWMCLGVIPRR